MYKDLYVHVPSLETKFSFGRTANQVSQRLKHFQFCGVSISARPFDNVYLHEWCAALNLNKFDWLKLRRKTSNAVMHIDKD